MARIEVASQIYAAADDWRGQCLTGGKSLIWPEVDVWTPANLAQLKKFFIDNPDNSSNKSFEEKFLQQLAPGDENLTRLACDLLLVHLLFPDSIGRTSKIRSIQTVAAGKGLRVEENLPRLKCLNEGIGNPGQTYNTGRPNEITFLARFASRVIAKSAPERATLLNGALQTQQLLDELVKEHREDFGRPPQTRHVLLHLLFPDDYERIASEGHKQRICEVFDEVLEGPPPDDRDELLKAIRSKLREFLPDQELDFYVPPLRACWYTDAEGDGISELQALDIKKQIVLYGPPGTGKTYQAREVIANGLIRQKLLKLWGPKSFFTTPEEKRATLVAKRTHRVQFHPGYGYEDFIRGLQIGANGQTEYMPGVLLTIISAMGDEPDESRSIPVVLILDEMNRADLSKVLGECFSLLEDRNTDIVLAGHDQEPKKIRLPENLYIVGTMNEIDQSLEHVDFALRRRFLWFFRGFDDDDFMAVAKARWDSLHDTKKVYRKWSDVEPEFELLAERATQLNSLIDTNTHLGRRYQIGHTYFCEVVAFAEKYLTNSEKRRNLVLFNRNKVGLEPIETLWRYSLEPLLQQYLSGADTEEREAFVGNARQILLRGGGE